MSNLKELQEKLDNIVADARAHLDEADVATDEARKKELNEAHDGAMAYYDKVRERFEREQKIDELEKSQEAAKELAERREREALRPVVEEKSSANYQPIVGPTYRQAFHAYVKAGGKMSDISSEMRAKLMEKRTLTAGTGADGGFTVPEEMRNILIRSMEAFGPMYTSELVTSIVTESGNKMPFPTIEDTPSGDTSFSTNKLPGKKGEGVDIKKLTGSTSPTEANHDPTFSEKELDAYTYATNWVKVSQELMQDSAFAMESLVGSLLGERLGRSVNAQLTTGSGSASPEGVVTGATAPATVSVTATASAGITLTADHLIDLYHRLDPAYTQGNSLAFMMNQKTLGTLRKVKTTGGDYVLAGIGGPGGQLTPGMAGTLLGVPVIVNQAMVDIPTAAAADQRPIIFGDFSKYYVRKVQDITLGAQQDTTNWPNISVAGFVRFDGVLADRRAIQAFTVTVT